MRLQVFINQECTSVPLALPCRAAQLSAAEQQLSSCGALGNHKQQSAKLCNIFSLTLNISTWICKFVPPSLALNVIAERK